MQKCHFLHLSIFDIYVWEKSAYRAMVESQTAEACLEKKKVVNRVRDICDNKGFQYIWAPESKTWKRLFSLKAWSKHVWSKGTNYNNKHLNIFKTH